MNPPAFHWHIFRNLSYVTLKNSGQLSLFEGSEKFCTERRNNPSENDDWGKT